MQAVWYDGLVIISCRNGPVKRWAARIKHHDLAMCGGGRGLSNLVFFGVGGLNCPL